MKMTPTKWYALGAIVSAVALAVIVAMMNHVPQGFASAPPATPAGMLQAIIAALSASGFTIASVVSFIVGVIKQHHANPNTPPNTDPVTTSDVLDDLIIAFPDYIADRTNKAKSMRFWFDLIQFGIEHDQDNETRAWLQQGSEILRKKFFPPVTPVDLTPATK